ncbi:MULTISPECIES: heme-binding domain-containing protein [Chryseobacterium]|uniref:Cytochrome C n=1 Tax=Chryseobacterium rhizosphaerae TaxID=395937 RepID=A0ABX9IH82_9FLAO|nr:MULTISPECIES: heme-binding domain-containing protein [Chryseobacterium]MBL3550359.1 heme-binding domain-containing protein [Chryseobacterium sp. KMC2]REC73619.1 cytochrome C [Chryseobacterium rhizosphaerae]GEN69370.1 heme-binding protein [Chryseobacterium rhizosphaerae]
MKPVKKILLGFILIFLIVQMIQPARNIDYGQVPSSDISKIYQVPQKVQSILKTSCYDCHSNSTDYPVYAYVQPVSSYLENHIQKGKKELNFNEWGLYSQRKQTNKLKAIANQVKQRKMPLPSYLYLHQDAKLSKEKVEEIVNWIESLPTEK